MGMGDHPAERVDARGTLRPPRKMIKMEHKPGSNPFWLLWLIGLAIAGTMVVGYVIIKSNRRLDDQKKSAIVQQENAEPRDPAITMTKVTDDVFLLDFGGEYCDTTQCLRRAIGLVLEQTPGRRIVSMAPPAVGTYGSTALIVITAPTQSP